MCGECGCEDKGHHHKHSEHEDREITVQENLLSFNDKLAAWNRGFFAAKKILAVNFLSGDGAGKTTLLEAMLERIAEKDSVFVIEGDLQTDIDAERIRKTGVRAVQINTGTGCHLDAHGIHHVLEKEDLQENSLLFIENVGNLVCPAAFDLGESLRVVLLSVAEGEEKPLKYPHIFVNADAMVISKMDMEKVANFDSGKAEEYAKRGNPDISVFRLCARTGEGVDTFVQWILKQKKG